MSYRYRNISNLQGGEKLTSWQQKSRQKKAQAEEKAQVNLEARPDWNTSLADNPHKLSHAEILQRKLNSKSKNEASARADYQKKLQKLKKGEVPEEYKDITDRGKKQYSSKQAFIENKRLAQEYENRSYVTQSEIDFDEPTLGSARPRTGLKKTSSVSRIGTGSSSARGIGQGVSKITRPGSAFGRTNPNKVAQESGIPRPGIKRGQQVTANQDGNINISAAKPMAMNFTGSNQANTLQEDPRAGFESYEIPEHVPFSSQQLQFQQPRQERRELYAPPPDTDREVNQLVDLLNQNHIGAHSSQNAPPQTAAPARPPIQNSFNFPPQQQQQQQHQQLQQTGEIQFQSDFLRQLMKANDIMDRQAPANEPQQMGGQPDHASIPGFQQQHPLPQQEVPNQRPKDFDYLDFRENEKTLEQLRQQNMNSYAHFLDSGAEGGSIQPKPPAQVEIKSKEISNVVKLDFKMPAESHASQQQTAAQGAPDDLQNCFNNLDQLLAANRKQEEDQKWQFQLDQPRQALPSTSMMMMQEQKRGSPKSLLPNYGALFDQIGVPQPAPTSGTSVPQYSERNQPQQQYSQIQEPLPSQRSVRPNGGMNSPGLTSIHNHSPQHHHQQNLPAHPAFQKNQFNQQIPSATNFADQRPFQQHSTSQHAQMPQYDDFQPYQQRPAEPQPQPQAQDEDEEDFARMRALLESTQSEIDRIIQGSDNIQDVYTESQQAQSMSQGAGSGGNNAQIVGGRVVKEVSLNAATLSSLPQQQSYQGSAPTAYTQVNPERELYGAPTVQQRSFISGMQGQDILMGAQNQSQQPQMYQFGQSNEPQPHPGASQRSAQPSGPQWRDIQQPPLPQQMPNSIDFNQHLIQQRHF